MRGDCGALVGVCPLFASVPLWMAHVLRGITTGTENTEGDGGRSGPWRTVGDLTKDVRDLTRLVRDLRVHHRGTEDTEEDGESSNQKSPSPSASSVPLW